MRISRTSPATILRLQNMLQKATSPYSGDVMVHGGEKGRELLKRLMEMDSVETIYLNNPDGTVKFVMGIHAFGDNAVM